MKPTRRRGTSKYGTFEFWEKANCAKTKLAIFEKFVQKERKRPGRGGVMLTQRHEMSQPIYLEIFFEAT